mmetsp:Transcript_60084/g.135173  ORF Transcript_60084/g.135173 Transcript_60084/m.135173 type:complete len:418 (+) Transcript_60084:48-1301(+)
MRFRPCIDLHNGVVKQIVGSTLTDDPEKLQTNFAATKSSKEFAQMYCQDGLIGGHVIMLGPNNDAAAKAALEGYPMGLQVGGGIKPSTAKQWLDAGASHVIVTSYVFNDGCLDYDRLRELVAACGGRERVVLDLSCRRKPTEPGGPYYVVMDKWQRFTDTAVTQATLDTLAEYCGEFLVHGVDVEGKACGIEENLVQCLGMWSRVPVTYAGGCRNLADINRVERLGVGRVDVTIGSALDIFGGELPYADVVAWDKAQASQAAAWSGPPAVAFKILTCSSTAKPGDDFCPPGSEDGCITLLLHGALQKELLDIKPESEVRIVSVRLDGLRGIEITHGAEAPARAEGFRAHMLPTGHCRIYMPRNHVGGATLPGEAVLSVEVLQRSSGEGLLGWHLPPYVSGSSDLRPCDEAAAKRLRT